MATDTLEIVLSDGPAKEAYDVILKGLVAYNEQQAGDGGHSPLTVYVKDGERILGGLSGAIYMRWLYIELFHLPKSLRGAGLGTRLMRAAEAEAARRGCVGVHLNTFDFQARGFYEKLGYELYGTLEGYPPGGRRFSMFRRL